MPPVANELLKYFLQPPVPARVRARQRIVLAVPIPIEILQILRILNQRIPLQKPPQSRIKQPPIHVHDADVVELFMPRVPPRSVPLLVSVVQSMISAPKVSYVPFV